MNKAPNVPLNEVEWRVDGKPITRQDRTVVCRFVPYVSASTVSELLDDWVGPASWRDEYQQGTVAGKEVMWCHLSVLCDEAWVTKTDLGLPTNFEGQKGAVSDAFKRAACLKWGIARNVYSLPSLWAPCRVDQSGKAWPNDQTIPSILAQLERAGYEASGARVQTEEVSAGSEAPPQASEPKATPVASQPEVSAPTNSWAEEETEGSAASGSRPSSSSAPTDWRELCDRFSKATVLRTARDTAKDLGVTPLPSKVEDLYEIKDTRVLEATLVILSERLVRT